VLCAFPRCTPSFGTFDHALPIAGVKAFMPPQGLLVIAGALPRSWEVRLVDENVRPVSDDDLAWADAVLLSGMHHQRAGLVALAARARAHGKLTVLGGPSVSARPDWYPEIDLLHVGELGDATDRLIARLGRDVSRPAEQEVYRTSERRDLADFPLPAYAHIDPTDYLMGSIQFSSGCPYRCEFCDIPELYGRRARLKSPARVVAELDALLARGNPGAIYFVDDNLVANPRAATELVRELAAWQEARGFPVQFACEGTLNMARRPELLALMREANFRTVFCGIETPEEDALRSMRKQQNLSAPILDAVRTLNDHGLEVVSGIIVGLDTDTERTYERIVEFVEASQIPLLTINILYALPQTPLWRRLEAAGRIVEDADGRESNVRFLLPHDTVVAGWRHCVTSAYEPAAVYRRFAHQLAHTYRRRRALPASPARVNARSVRRGLGIAARLAWRVGVRAPERREFWRMALPALRRGQVEEVVHVGLVAHHLIAFARAATGEDGERSFYAPGPGLPERPTPQLEPAPGATPGT
jgi:radical SAM superfamily enzyme YgiQ (UPF0313 family)